MRLFESKQISHLTRLSESSLIPQMNEKEYLLKHFFAYPEMQLNIILQKLADETGLDCRIDNMESFQIIVDESSQTEQNIGFLVVFRDSFGGIPKEGLLNHNVGSIEYRIWLKKLTLKLR